MSLLKEIVKNADMNELIESAAAGSTSAGGIAGFRGRIGNATSEKTKMFARSIPTYTSSEEEEETNQMFPVKLNRRTIGHVWQSSPGDWNAELNSTGSTWDGIDSREDAEELLRDEQSDSSEQEEELGSTSRRRKRRNVGMSGPVGGSFSLRFESDLSEGPEDEKFDPADVISKLRAAQEKANKEDNTAGFALEDQDGQIIKVYVAADEAEEFEKALGAALGGEDGDDDDENTSLEIAEVLFNLKDRYSIVDVVWPPVDGDPEEQETSGDGSGDLEDDMDINASGDAEGGEEGDAAEGDAEGDEADMEAALQGDEEGGDLGDEGDEGDDTADAKSALGSVIDLLKAQADATKAEANAKEAEANAEEAKYNAQVADTKMKREEEVLDMEAHYDKQKASEKEAKKLKDLAKWKHETAQTADDALNDVDVELSKEVDVDVEPPQEEEEEKIPGSMPGEEIPGNKFEIGFDEDRNNRMSPQEFIKYILQHQRAQ